MGEVLDVPEAGSGNTSLLGHACFFCNEQLDKDAPNTWKQVVSWVHGPKSDGPVLRHSTGYYAHDTCIKKKINGQAVDQMELPFE